VTATIFQNTAQHGSRVDEFKLTKRDSHASRNAIAAGLTMAFSKQRSIASK
jgi:hypothetical protein